MINSLRAKSTGPWTIDQETMIPSGYMSIISRISNKADVYNDRRHIFPKINSVKVKERPNLLSHRITDYSAPKVEKLSHEDQFKGYLSKIKLQQLVESDQRRGISPVRKLSPISIKNVREYPGISLDGVRRLMNNTFTRLNHEQAHKRARAARERRLELEKLAEYDEKPINVILEEKHLDTVINDYHDLDKVPDIVINDLRVERMFKKLDKAALSSRRESPRPVGSTINSTTRRTARQKSVDRDLVNKTVGGAAEGQQEEGNKILTLSNDDDDEDELNTSSGRPVVKGLSTINASIFANTEAIELKKANFRQRLDLSRVQHNRSVSKKLSKSALSRVKLSDTSFVEDPFTMQAIESFINDNYETTLEPADTDKKGSHQQLLVLGPKKSNILIEGLGHITPTSRASRTNANSPFRDMSSKRGLLPLSSKNQTLSQKEEFSQRFTDFQKHLEVVKQTNIGDMRIVDNFNTFLTRDHGRLRIHADKIVPANQREMNLDLDTIKAAVMLELKLEKAKENSIEGRRMDRLHVLSDKKNTKNLISLTHKMLESESRASRKAQQRINKIFTDLEIL